MQKNTVVLIHGYAEKGESFQAWKLKLEALGYTVKVLGYTSLSDEVTLKDIAEGFERALHLPGGLKNDEPFDVIVHSTGMLVIRTWLAAYPEQRHRLQHIIGLAPASFGSPIAHRARSFMAKLMRSNREWGEKFFENGYLILDALELGSRYIWDLTHQDLLGNDSIYLNNGEPPYVFIFCGTSEYGGFKKMIRQAGAGTDGTVRWVGCSLNTRKITIDLTKPLAASNQINIGAWQNTSVVPMAPIAGLNHATILKQPTDVLVEMVDSALQVSKQSSVQTWSQKYSGAIKSEYDKIAHWQQFIVRAVDENGDAILDYALKLVTKINGEYKPIEGIELDEHIYARDTSLRCFQVNITLFKTKQIENVWLQIKASSGSQLVQYKGYTSSESNQTTTGTWQGEINLTDTIYDSDQQILQPLTTTLIELRLNREPCQQGVDANNKVSWFLTT